MIPTVSNQLFLERFGSTVRSTEEDMSWRTPTLSAKASLSPMLSQSVSVYFIGRKTRFVRCLGSEMPGLMCFTYHFRQIRPDPLVIDAPVYCKTLPSALTLNDEQSRL